MFQQAEQAFGRRKLGSENLAQAEKQLSNLACLCKEQPAGLHAKEQLRVVQEELANHSLSIALFYLGKFYDGRGGQAGAVSRLKHIIERYPEYSKLDQALFLLGEINMKARNFDEAAGYYRQLISAYPASQYTGEASLQLNAIGILKN
ncbi:MAG TPA: tetratricopeptide repeat protein [Pyrinomonadaceae bacterium]